MTRPAGTDPLEELLSAAPELEGAEFTTRVLERLPRHRSAARSSILGAGGILAGVAGAGLLAFRPGSLSSALLAILAGRVPEGAGLLALLTLAVVGATTAIVAAGELGDDPPLPPDLSAAA